MRRNNGVLSQSEYHGDKGTDPGQRTTPLAMDWSPLLVQNRLSQVV